MLLLVLKGLVEFYSVLYGTSFLFVVYQCIFCSTLKCGIVFKVTALTLIEILWMEYCL